MSNKKKKKLYWFEAIGGKTYTKEFKTKEEAHHHFMMEGDHMWDYGPVIEKNKRK